MNDEVTLTVSRVSTPKPETYWRYTTGTNGEMYAFSFEDKAKNKSGYLHVVKDDKEMRFKVKLADGAGKNFEILNVETHYGDGQFSYIAKESNGKTAIIKNANTKIIQGVYCVVVLDADPPKGLVYCDPMISNDPR